MPNFSDLLDANKNTSFAIRGGIGGPNNGIVFMRLKPRGERKASAPQIISELMPELSQVPGMRVFMQVPPPIRIGGTLTKSEYQLTLQGTDTKELYRVAPIVADELASRRRESTRRISAAPGRNTSTSPGDSCSARCTTRATTASSDSESVARAAGRAGSPLPT